MLKLKCDSNPRNPLSPIFLCCSPVISIFCAMFNQYGLILTQLLRSFLNGKRKVHYLQKYLLFLLSTNKSDFQMMTFGMIWDLKSDFYNIQESKLNVEFRNEVQ